MKRNASALAKPAHAAPEDPGSTAFLWAGIIGAAGGSLIFNLSHDVANLTNVLDAIAAGILPPFLSVAIGHAIKKMRQGWAKVVVFLITIGAMAVSAKATATVLAPASGMGVGYLFSLVCDAADLMLLFALIQHHEAARAYRDWLAGHPHVVPAQPPAGAPPVNAGMVPGPAVPAARREPVPAIAVPAAGPAVPAAQPEPVPAATVPALPAVPGTAPAAISAPAPAARKDGAQAAAARLASRPAAQDGDAPAGESREDVTSDIAARPQPAAESVEHRAQRVRGILAEFAARTGQRMNNQELGKALGIRKAEAGVIRKEIEAAAGEAAA